MIFDSIYLLFFLLMTLQGIFNMYLTLYAWEDPDRLDEVASPKEFAYPKVSFTVLLPARHEEKVIGETIKSIVGANYPKHLIQTLVICSADDTGTIGVAERAIRSLDAINSEVVVYSAEPINKPHGLNEGLKRAANQVVVIFDAEDEIDPDIFNVANTLYLQKKPDVIQAGVQLMNYDSQWFSSHNVLEYFFWFKSRMHYHTEVGVVPLGGNTVFFKTAQLRAVGGWNEQCLTEDAEIGIRLSTRGARILSTYDPRHVTKEETPDSVAQFIKQRTRWNQGFLQVLKYGDWKNYDSRLKRLLCFYTLSFPVVQAALLALTPIAIVFGLLGKLPVTLSLLSYLPVLIVLISLVISWLAMHEFIADQKLEKKHSVYLRMVLTFLPYQVLLGIAAFRASVREIRGQNNWEKTAHSGLHRIETEIATANLDVAS
ncbi:MAG TPA: glycosyltransferase [Candidatus Saccharimonadia bacterium]|jgi:cellulose synthase/poly-beta-1,6-N-acetylglucosamine synthase-like glycosyltransferase